MPRLMLVALLASSGCAVGYVTGKGGRDVPITQTGAASRPLIVTIEGSSGVLCSPEDSDPAHACPSQSGPDQR